MSKSSQIAKSLPPIAQNSLCRLGENLAIARARRKESRRTWSERIGISIPTLIRLEKGDPTVSIGAYATALWLMGRVQALADVTSPEKDLGALEVEVRKIIRRTSSKAAKSRPPASGDLA